MHSSTSLSFFCALFGLIVFAQCQIRAGRGDNVAQPSISNPSYTNSDLQSAASGYQGHGRVHIRVYRGPTDGHFAPHGYWVKQPADE